MILPSKHISEDYALIGVGAVLLRHLEHPRTVTGLWDRVRDDSSVGTYERFVLGLDMLHITGLIELSEGLIQRSAG